MGRNFNLKHDILSLITKNNLLVRRKDIYELCKENNLNGNVTVAIKTLRNEGKIKRIYYGKAKSQAVWGLPKWFVGEIPFNQSNIPSWFIEQKLKWK